MRRYFSLIVVLCFLLVIMLKASDKHLPFCDRNHTSGECGTCYGYAMARSFGRGWDHAVCPSHCLNNNTIHNNYFYKLPGDFNYDDIRTGDILEWSSIHAVYVSDIGSGTIYIDEKESPSIHDESLHVPLGYVESRLGSSPNYIWRRSDAFKLKFINEFGDGSNGGYIKIGKSTHPSGYVQNNLIWEQSLNIDAIEDGNYHNGNKQIFVDWFYEGGRKYLAKSTTIEVIHRNINSIPVWKAKFDDELLNTITGPTYLPEREVGTFIANPSGGSGSYTNYQWWFRNDEEIIEPFAANTVIPLAPPPGVWIDLSQYEGGQTITWGPYFDFSLKCKVTDSYGSTAEDIHSVFYVGYIPKNVAKKNQTVTIEIIPEQIALVGNYPNPFNPTTSIKFGLPDAMPVEISIYSITGKKVRTLINQELSARYYHVNWDGTDKSGNRVASGIYIYTLKAGSKRLTNKMLFAK